MNGNGGTIRTPAHVQRPSGTAIVTKRPEVGNRLLEVLAEDAEVYLSLDEVPKPHHISLFIVDLACDAMDVRSAPADVDTAEGESTYLWLAENLDQLVSLGSFPARSYVVDISRDVTGPVRDRLAHIRKLADPPRITDVAFVASHRTLAFAFADGRRHSVPLSAVPSADGSSVLEITLLYQGSAASVVQSSGNRFEIPWDFVLHWADTDYEYHRGRPDVSRSREEAARVIAGRVRAQRKKRDLTQQQLADLTGIRRPNVARLERGIHAASLETLERVAMALGTTVAELVAK